MRYTFSVREVFCLNMKHTFCCIKKTRLQSKREKHVFQSEDNMVVSVFNLHCHFDFHCPSCLLTLLWQLEGTSILSIACLSSATSRQQLFGQKDLAIRKNRNLWYLERLVELFREILYKSFLSEAHHTFYLNTDFAHTFSVCPAFGRYCGININR